MSIVIAMKTKKKKCVLLEACCGMPIKHKIKSDYVKQIVVLKNMSIVIAMKRTKHLVNMYNDAKKESHEKYDALGNLLHDRGIMPKQKTRLQSKYKIKSNSAQKV